MMPGKGLAPVLSSFRAATPSNRAVAHIVRNQSSRPLSTASLKQHARGTIRPQFLPHRAFVQQRNISWSPNTWFGASSPPAQTPVETVNTASSYTQPESAAATASTSPTANTSSIASSSTPATVPQTPAAPTEPTVSATDFSDINLDSVYNVGDSYLAAVPERIGYLKELGIDYGWGPTSMLQWTLEHVHVYGGLPWWGSIMTSAVLLRVCLFPLFLKSADMQARMQALKPITEPATARMTEAARSGDALAIQRAREELKTLYARADISMKALFTPLIIQGVIAYCALKLMRAMASLPVPGFETGGALWFTDLTLTDPYLLLPALMGVSMHMVFRFGGESGNQMMAGNPGMKTIMLYVAPVAIFLSMSWFQAAVNLWLASTGSFAIIQARLLQKNSVREAIGIAPLVTPEPTKSNTIDVKATSRRTESSAGVQYQAPNIKFSNIRQSESEPSIEMNQPSVGVVDRFKGFLAEQANALGQMWTSIIKRGEAARARFLGQDKESKTRSREFMDRANAYERRTQMRKGKGNE